MTNLNYSCREQSFGSKQSEATGSRINQTNNHPSKNNGIKVRPLDRNECPDISPTLRTARNLGSLLRHPFLDLYRLEGQYKDGPISVLIASDVSSTLGYMRDLIFTSGEVKISKKGRISALNAHNLAKSDADLVVIGANSLLLDRYTRKGFYIIPKWVRLFLPITGHPDEIIQQLDTSARKDLSRNVRRMLERGFGTYLTTDDKWFDQFYYDMLKPFAEQRFSEQAIVRSYKKVKKTFKKGLGIVITRDNEPVAGAIAYRHVDTLITPIKGIMHGDEQLARDGVSTALHYYTIEMAHSSGCTGIDFSRSRPFLCDGVLSYKLRWGMELVNEDIGTAAFAVVVPFGREPGRRFLDDHPFIHLSEDGLALCSF